MKSKAIFAIAVSLLARTLVMGQAPAPAQLPAANPVVCEGQPGGPQAPPVPPQVQNPGPGPAQPQGGAPQPQRPRDVTVTAIRGIVAAGAKFTQVWQTTGNNADGIVAMPDGSLLVNQEDNSAIIRIDNQDRASVFLSDTHGSGSLSMDRQGRLYAVQRVPQPGTPAAVNPSAPKVAGISILLPERKMLAETFADGTKWRGRPNDLSVDRMGGAYFSQGCVYYASPAGSITLVSGNIRSNGIVLSSDDKTLYVTNGPTLSVFDVEAPGRLTNRREWMLQAGGNGDGTAVDAAGRVYVASAPGVQIFSPQGAYVGLIPTPRPITGEAFAGPGRKTLYIVGTGSTDAGGQPTTQGASGRTIYRIPLLAEGLAGRSK